VPAEQEESAAAIDPSKILVRAFRGYLWSPITKRLYAAITREENGPSTFERPFSVQIGYGFESPIVALSPLDYPTADTAEWVLNWARQYWPTLIFDIIVPEPSGGFVTESQYLLVAWNGQDLYEAYSAGQWAFLFDRDGQDAAYAARTAELKQAGFAV
jgi:hypothetical protein